MPAFSYEAVDSIGTAKKGVVNADSARAARADLRAQGLIPLSVDAIASQLDEAGLAKRGGFGDHLSTVELALFMRQLSSLLEASLPLERAFSALLEQAKRTCVRKNLSDNPRFPAAIILYSLASDRHYVDVTMSIDVRHALRYTFCA